MKTLAGCEVTVSLKRKELLALSLAPSDYRAVLEGRDPVNLPCSPASAWSSQDGQKHLKNEFLRTWTQRALGF